MSEKLFLVILCILAINLSNAQNIKWVEPDDNSHFEIISALSLAEVSCRSSNRSYIGVNIHIKDTCQIITSYEEVYLEIGDTIQTKTIKGKRETPDVTLIKGTPIDQEEPDNPDTYVFPSFWAKVKKLASKPKKAPIAYQKGKTAIEKLKQNLTR